MSASLANTYMTAKIWMHYSVTHVASTALLCSKMTSDGILEVLGELPPDPLVLLAYACKHTHQTSM